MIKLEKLILRAKEDKGKVYFKDGEILVIEAGYIDTRTRFDLEQNSHIVKPVTFHKGHFWYICPDCSKLHVTSILGKIETGCCLNVDCKRHQYINGKHHLIKREPIILDNEC